MNGLRLANLAEHNVTMANSGDPSTFSFTIDCFPAYTKFNKMKKVLATLQVIDPTEAHHNYANKDIIGHDDRTGDNDDYIEGLYDKSVFDQVSGTTEGGGTEGGGTKTATFTADANQETYSLPLGGTYELVSVTVNDEPVEGCTIIGTTVTFPNSLEANDAVEIQYKVVGEAARL